MRWRTENEVIAGKGQFICGNKVCDCGDNLKSWEVNFSYIEKGVKKNTLVKLSEYRYIHESLIQCNFIDE